MSKSSIYCYSNHTVFAGIARIVNEWPGRVAQSVARLTQEPEDPGSPVRPHTFVSLSAGSRRAVVSYWRKYVHEVLVNRLRDLSLPRKIVVRLTDRPDMTIAV